jgi:hypothetical protein
MAQAGRECRVSPSSKWRIRSITNGMLPAAFFPIFALLTLGSMAHPAAAQDANQGGGRSSDRNGCSSRKPDVAIIACTNIIEDLREDEEHGACTQLLGVHFVNGAGHSLAEEQPEQVNRLLFDFLRQAQ